MDRIGVSMVLGFALLGGCQTSPSKKQADTNWKPWVLKKYDANGDGQLSDAELKHAVADRRLKEARAAQAQ